MEIQQLLTNLIGSLLSVYLPIEDIGTRFLLSTAITALVSKIFIAIITFLSTLAFWSYVFKNETYIIITNANPMYDKILKWIRDHNDNDLLGCRLNNDTGNGKNLLVPIKFKNSSFNNEYKSNGKSYTMKISLDDTKKGSDSATNKSDADEMPDIIIKSTADMKIIEAYMHEVIQNFNTSVCNKIPIYRIHSSNGKKKDYKDLHWKCSVIKMSKNMKNTIVSETVKRNFYTDIDKFINSEEVYLNKGLPYKHGYILYGEPGCGKTSLIKAIANQYKLPIFIADVSIIENNTEFIKIMNEISSHLVDDQKYLVVFEDIDRSNLFGWRSSITHDCVLNILDGIDEYHGRITIMTTNDIEKIKNIQALMRPGRIDTIIEVTFCTTAQITEMLGFYFDDFDSTKYELNPAIVISPANLTQLILVVNNPDKICELLNKNVNFSKIKVEKMNEIYQTNAESANSQDGIPEEKKIDADEESESDDDPESLASTEKKIVKRFSGKIKFHENRMSIWDIKIDAQTDTDKMSEKDRIAYDRLILSKKSALHSIGELKNKMALALQENKIKIEGDDEKTLRTLQSRRQQSRKSKRSG